MDQNQLPINSQDTTVLIVEDNLVNMLLVKSILENVIPHAILWEAENGLIAVEKCKSAKPDLIFMDVRMPVKNGYDATREIRNLEEKRSVPIIALTAGITVGERERCLEAGMDDYISKPITQGALKAAIIKWLSPDPNQSLKDQKSVYHKSASILVHYNVEELKTRVMNREDLVQSIIRAAKSGMDICMKQLKQQLQEDDFFSMMETAHKLKGMAMSACFDELAKRAAELEELSKTDYKLLGDKMKEIEQEIKLIKLLIE